MVSYRKFVKDVGLIGTVQILTSLGTFFLLPIITKTLGTYDYGLWAQINIIVSLISSLALMGLSAGFVRFLSAETDQKTIREAVYSILSFVTISGFLASLLVYMFAEPLATFVFKDPKATYFIQAGSALILLSVVESISLFYFRVFRQIKKYSYFTLFETFGKLFFILILVKVGYGLLGIIGATILVQGSIVLISLVIMVSQIGFIIPRFTHIKEYLQFSLPLTPSSLVRWITESSDRFLVNYFLGLGSAGVYSAAYSIGTLIQLLVTPLQVILLPELSKLFDENKLDQVKIYLSSSLRYFLLITVPAVFGLSALAKPLLGIFTTQDFLSGWLVIPIVAFSGLLAGVFQIFVNIMFLVKETKSTTYINIIAAVSNVLLNLLLIPSIGFIGAALSTLISYFLMIVLCIYVSRKHFVFDYYYYDIAKSILSSFGMYLFVSHFAISSIFELFEIAGMGVLIYVVMMFMVGGFSDHELSLIRKYLFKVKGEVKQ
ncbi:flippase [Methanosarcina sp. UBA5]|uniref:flippase n=1 Tax=Methanosarcina sp. UBA5 TaxID=1915593 RepID=UPI0025E36FBF|nr:flippase [Methanosarcina sp. UBA5]